MVTEPEVFHEQLEDHLRKIEQNIRGRSNMSIDPLLDTFDLLSM